MDEVIGRGWVGDVPIYPSKSRARLSALTGDPASDLSAWPF
jgi:hypothetical protein